MGVILYCVKYFKLMCAVLHLLHLLHQIPNLPKEILEQIKTGVGLFSIEFLNFNVFTFRYYRNSNISIDIIGLVHQNNVPRPIYNFPNATNAQPLNSGTYSYKNIILFINMIEP